MATSYSVCVYIVYDNRANFVRIIERLIGIHPYGGCAKIAPPLKDTRVGIMECKSHCTNAIRILGKYMYLPFIVHLIEELQTRLLQCGDIFKTHNFLTTQTHHLIDADVRGHTINRDICNLNRILGK